MEHTEHQPTRAEVTRVGAGNLAGDFRAGIHPRLIARRRGISDATVRYWLAQWRQAGLEALLEQPARPDPDQPANTFSRYQEARLVAWLRKGPLAAGWPDERWSRERIHHYAQHRLGVRITVEMLGHRLKQLGWRTVPDKWGLGLTWAEVNPEEQQRRLGAAGRRISGAPRTRKGRA